MTARFRYWTFRSAVTVLALGALTGHARSARAQACCASAGLVAPTRLRTSEDFAVGAQGRGRSVFGAFDAAGNFANTTAGESEWSLEQDLFGVARIFERGQVALLLPFVETDRRVPGIGSFGGGVGDLSVNLRYDFVRAGDYRMFPGLAVLFAVLFPTGKPPEDATDALAAGATGQGSSEMSMGVAFEQAVEPYFLTVNNMLTLRGSRHVGGVKESFAPRFTGSVAAGRVLPRGATLGAFASALGQGNNSDARGSIAGSASFLLTAGLAFTISPTDQLRIQGSVFADAPAAHWGRNQTTGAGASVSVIRVWP